MFQTKRPAWVLVKRLTYAEQKFDVKIEPVFHISYFLCSGLHLK